MQLPKTFPSASDKYGVRAEPKQSGGTSFDANSIAWASWFIMVSLRGVQELIAPESTQERDCSSRIGLSRKGVFEPVARWNWIPNRGFSDDARRRLILLVDRVQGILDETGDAARVGTESVDRFVDRNVQRRAIKTVVFRILRETTGSRLRAKLHTEMSEYLGFGRSVRGTIPSYAHSTRKSAEGSPSSSRN